MQTAQLVDEQMDGVMISSNQINSDLEQQQQFQYQQQQQQQQQNYQQFQQQSQNNLNNASAHAGRYSIEHPQGFFFNIKHSINIKI
jgi:hypothetical protein